MTVREAINSFSRSLKITKSVERVDEVDSVTCVWVISNHPFGWRSVRIKPRQLSNERRWTLAYLRWLTTATLRRYQQTTAAFRALIAAGGSLLVIEHNLDVIKTGDYVIDLNQATAWTRRSDRTNSKRLAKVRATGRYLKAHLAIKRSSNGGVVERSKENGNP